MGIAKTTGRAQFAESFPGLLSLGLFVCIVMVGLWPFGSPRNRVEWLRDKHGLRFYGPSSLLSVKPVEFGLSEASPVVLELRLRPFAIRQSGTLISFYNSATRGSFSISQQQDDLELRLDSKSETRRVYFDGAFRFGDSQQLTLTFDTRGTRLFADRIEIQPSLPFSVRPANLTGRLVIGDAPTSHHSWRGELTALRLYQALTSCGVAGWHCSLPRFNSFRTVLRYSFNEGAGRLVHDRAGDNDLVIADRYTLLDQISLQMPWKEYRASWTYFEDAAINIAGFVPFGFALRVYIARRFHIASAAAVTIGAGAALSATIEFLQSYLPTRDSGITDLIMNTAGAALGTSIWRLSRLAFVRTLQRERI